MAVEYSTRQFTVYEYKRMAEEGIIGADERVELIDGEVVAVPPMGDEHRSAIARANAIFTARFQGRALILPQVPIPVSYRSMPEPDFAIVRPDPNYYVDGPPRITDIYALVEDSDSRLSFDRGKKLSVYARAGIREYWIVNIRDDVVEVYRDPHELGYRDRPIVARGERIALLAFPHDTIAAEELLPGKAPA